MADPWQITNRSAAGAPASASVAAPASANAQNRLVARLRALQCSIQAVAAGTDQLVVRDGASGVGAIIWQSDIQVAVGAGLMWISESGMDLRASPGNPLTVEFVAGVASDREAVNAQGDFVPQGYPPFMS